jgi:3'-phosphoadenosine 5'-phosphosulfate sulfotransferase (PAPS reductase)/FAD synthetase
MTNIRENIEFKKWFGDSKVVDSNGMPLVVYHGTQGNFSIFKDAFDGGMWFTDNPEVAEDFIFSGMNANIIPVYLSIQNPFIVDFEGRFLDDSKELVEISEAVNQGHDGIIAKNVLDYVNKEIVSNVYVTFEPTQIKSIHNTGTFDKNNPDIMMEQGGVVQTKKHLLDYFKEFKINLDPKYIDSMSDEVWDFGYKNGETIRVSTQDMDVSEIKKVKLTNLAFIIWQNQEDTQYWCSDKKMMDNYYKFKKGGTIPHYSEVFKDRTFKSIHDFTEKDMAMVIALLSPCSHVSSELHYTLTDRLKLKQATIRSAFDKYFHEKKMFNMDAVNDSNFKKIYFYRLSDEVRKQFPDIADLEDDKLYDWVPYIVKQKWIFKDELFKHYKKYLAPRKKKKKSVPRLINEMKGCILNQDCDSFLIDEVISNIKATYIDNGIAKRFNAETVDKQRKEVIELIRKPDTRIMLAFSGGKDSIAMFFHLLELGIPVERIELHHHDIDGHSEDLFDWKCTVDYVKAFAKEFNVRLFFSYRDKGIIGGIYRDNQPNEDIFFQSVPDGEYTRSYSDQKKINTRLKFPAVSADLGTRWCSSYVKIDVLRRAITNQASLSKANIVVLTGERRAESTARAKYKEIQMNDSLTSKNRLVINWRCVIDYSDKDVWNVLKKYKVQPHPAYELGWSRCSCQTCVFNSPNTWASLAEISPEKIDRINEIEISIGHTLYHKKVKGKNEKITIYEKVASGESFLTDQLKNDWEDQAINSFTKPIKIENWELPLGAKSTEVSGAN